MQMAMRQPSILVSIVLMLASTVCLLGIPEALWARPSGGSLTIRVHLPRNETPRDFDLFLVSAETGIESRVQVRDGRASVHGLAPGRYRIVVDIAGFQRCEKSTRLRGAEIKSVTLKVKAPSRSKGKYQE